MFLEVTFEGGKMKNIIKEKLNDSEFICKGGWKSGNTIIFDDGAERNIDYKEIENTEYVSIILTPKDVEKLNIELKTKCYKYEYDC